MNFLPDPVVKIILVGDTGVGKSSLLLTYAEEHFPGEHTPTIGVDFRFRRVKVNNQTIKLQIWDTAGQERFRAISASYFRGSDIICLMYDITNKDSFESLKKDWIPTMQRTIPIEEIMLVLIGNKSDKEARRHVSQEEGAMLAASLHAGFFEASVRLRRNVTEVFDFMATHAVSKKTESISIKEAEATKATKEKKRWFC